MKTCSLSLCPLKDNKVHSLKQTCYMLFFQFVARNWIHFCPYPNIQYVYVYIQQECEICQILFCTLVFNLLLNLIENFIFMHQKSYFISPGCVVEAATWCAAMTRGWGKKNTLHCIIYIIWKRENQLLLLGSRWMRLSKSKSSDQRCPSKRALKLAQ